jgi:hypothetical protein
MRELARHAVARCALATATVASVVGLEDTAGQHGMVVVDLLSSDRQAEAIQSAEAVEIRARESSVEHVEVFRVADVGTSIIGRPRASTCHRRADHHTVNCEEPL